MIGQTLGHYRIDSKLGEGGMGVVYRAFDTHLDRAVAIKVLRPDAIASPDRKRRFVQEAKSASALNHPGIVHIYDIDSANLPDGPTDFIAMEFVPGKTLDQYIGKSGLSLKDALKYGIQIADALARAHAAGIVHRDLKPANIIVADDGRVKLLDFGLAKLTEVIDGDPEGATATMAAQATPQTEEGAILGTVAYMSPEQAEARKVDGRSDIFSFGSVLYEMVTGRRAFEGTNKISTLGAILHTEPKAASEISAGVPTELDKIIARCLRKDPERRAQGIADIKLALEELKQESESGLSGQVGAATAVRPPARPPRRFVAITAGVVALVVAAAGLAWWLLKRPASAPARSEWVQITNLPDSAVQPALSPDGRMLTFIRGPSSFNTTGQVYVKMLPSGEPVQLTRDNRTKMSPVFSPDGSRIAYSVTGGIWDMWAVPVLGGEPRLWLPNASGLVWIDKSKLLFSEIKDQRQHMAIVTSDESRAGSRDLYVPPHERGMAHRSYPSPDGKWMLLVEMNERGAIVRCRLAPMDGSSTGQQVGPPTGSMYLCRMVARWGVDVLQLRLRRGLPYLASALPRRPARADYFGADRRRRTRHGARRPLVHHGRGIDAEFRLVARRRRRSASLAGRLRLQRPNSPPMGSGCSTRCEKELRANCGWRNSIPDAASRCCRALPLQRLGLDPTEVTTFRRTAVRSLWRHLMAMVSCGCGSRRSTAARRPGKFPTSKVNSPSSAQPVKSFSAASRAPLRSFTVSRKTEASCGKPSTCPLLPYRANPQTVTGWRWAPEVWLFSGSMAALRFGRRSGPLQRRSNGPGTGSICLCKVRVRQTWTRPTSCHCPRAK